ncbi:MAG: mechanosensitive ion channel [Desulfobulbaceae bacterium]|nr:mechanosensitive ion channel [Desulfobulbaceae bacterium]
MTENTIISYLRQLGLPEQVITLITYGAVMLLVFLLALLATWAIRRSLIRFIHHLVRGNRLHWDDALVNNHFFRRLSWFVPVVIFHITQDLLLPPDSQGTDILRRLIVCGFVLVGVGSVNALLNSINDIYRSLHGRTGKTIRGYIDATKILIYVLGIIFLIAVLTDRSPWGLISVMGGLTAVTMLVFRDSILGFIASIQLTGTDMIRVGDWIEMDSHGADGDVIEISIHSVRVRNWDKTITTIPTYALISKSFINWRGMSESGGRRIKRSLHLDMTSIRFLSDEELDNLAKIQILTDYIRTRQQEIEQYNKKHGVDPSVIINGRRQTNAGLFRAYVVAYLKQNPKIHKNMTFLVRQLEPGPDGLPLQIYVFSNDQVWARYEAIQADIFDHLIAVLPQFDLRVFQQPSGYDFRCASR